MHCKVRSWHSSITIIRYVCVLQILHQHTKWIFSGIAPSFSHSSITEARLHVSFQSILLSSLPWTIIYIYSHPLSRTGGRNRGGAGDDSGQRVKQAVDDHLHIVSELLADVHGKVCYVSSFLFLVPSVLCVIISLCVIIFSKGESCLPYPLSISSFFLRYRFMSYTQSYWQVFAIVAPYVWVVTN